LQGNKSLLMLRSLLYNSCMLRSFLELEGIQSHCQTKKFKLIKGVATSNGKQVETDAKNKARPKNSTI